MGKKIKADELAFKDLFVLKRTQNEKTHSDLASAQLVKNPLNVFILMYCRYNWRRRILVTSHREAVAVFFNYYFLKPG